MSVGDQKPAKNSLIDYQFRQIKEIKGEYTYKESDRSFLITHH